MKGAFTTDFDRKAAGFSPDRVDALVWAMTDLLVEEISSWGIYETTRRKAEAVIKAKLAAADAGRPKSEPGARIPRISGAAPGLEAAGGLAHAREQYVRHATADLCRAQ
jgi:hypothetical protein